MKRAFTKLQGLGNDFILFDDMAKQGGKSCIKLTPEIAIGLCDRRFGIGADGVFNLRNAVDQNVADIRWDFYNSDGSVAEMCGNAIRCVARYVFEKDLWPLAEGGVADDNDGKAEPSYGELRIETLAGVKSVGLVLDDEGRFLGARVDMGIADIDSDVQLQGRTYSRISMGNPHAVTFVEDLPKEFGAAPVSTEGPAIEVDSTFPNKTNVEYAVIESRDLIRMRVWERGAGETLACGTGACATAVAAHQKGFCDDRVTLELLGGSLTIEIAPDNRVFMTGPAEEVFTGRIHLTTVPCESPC
ncbi:MAG: diaminopimelate epimerase [Coriobacteriia bacterium]|nr:diaminopimelate epimerase [Coriobacteriia bacterium]